MESEPLSLNKLIGNMTIEDISVILDDYALEDLHEILLRIGLYLPARGGHWLTKKLMLAMW